MQYISKISRTKVAQISALAFVAVLAISYVNLSKADTFHNLNVSVGGLCGGEAQVIVVNGPDDGAANVTSGGGTSFTLHEGVFYLHIVPLDSSISPVDSGTIVLDSDQSVGVDAGGNCNPPPPPPPPPVDLCTNLAGIQETMPAGYEDPDHDGICTPINNPPPPPPPPPGPPPPPPPPPPNGPTADIKCNGSNGPCTIPVGTAVTISWTCTNSNDAVVLPNGWRGISGSKLDTLTSNRTYDLTCYGNGEAHDSVTVNVTQDVTAFECSPASQTASVNTTVNFALKYNWGITNRFLIWEAPGSTNPHQSGQNLNNFSTSYQSSGDYTVSLSSETPGNDIKYCHVTITGNQDGNLSMTKLVRNVTDSQDNFVSSASADPSEVIEFKINVTANNSIVNHVVFTDTLPSRLDYINNSLTIDGVASGNSLSNLDLGSISAGHTKTIVFRATVANSSEFDNGTTTLTNIASVTSSSNNASSSANVVVTKNVENPNLTVIKSVRNINDDSSFDDAGVNADAGDRVEFKITVTAHNSTAHNVLANDDLPSKLTLDSGSTDHNFGDVSAGESESYTFIAKVVSSSNLSCGSNTITNTVEATSSNAGSDTDSAFVKASRSCGGGGGGGSSNTRLSVTKSVRNVTTNTAFVSTVNANRGNVVEFRIVVKNTGSRTARDVIVVDNLPAGLTYVNGSFHVNSSTSSGSLFGRGQEIGDISRDSERILTFQAIVDTNAGQVLTNTASADADNANKVNSSASVNVVGVVAGIFVAPKTGSTTTAVSILSLVSVIGFAIIKRYQKWQIQQQEQSRF